MGKVDLREVSIHARIGTILCLCQSLSIGVGVGVDVGVGVGMEMEMGIGIGFCGDTPCFRQEGACGETCTRLPYCKGPVVY